MVKHLTKEQGIKKGYIIVGNLFLSKEEHDRYRRESNKPGGAYQISAYLKPKLTIKQRIIKFFKRIKNENN